MKFKFTGEITIAVLMILILLSFIRPTMLLMPSNLEMMLGLFLIILFLVFFSLVWKEKYADERENFHRLHAGRVSFMVGTSVLVIGIAFQSLSHDVDPWLVYTLILMILAKVGARVYSQLRH